MKRPWIVNMVLLPLSKLYGGVTAVRNKMFDWGILRQHTFDVPIISVGNIAVGGTGKTPHTEYIARTLMGTHRVGVLSRGYKRATKGFVMASDHSTPRDIGDEAYQVYNKFGGKVAVAVSESRVKGIKRMLEIDPKIDVIILDDAFQHRYVKPRISIVLTEYNRPVFEDAMLPYGRLREDISALSRADIVIATKCPADIKPIEFNIFDKNLNLIPAQARFFSRFRYERLQPLFPEDAVRTPRLIELTPDDMLLSVSGIGNPRPFVRYLKSYDARVKVNVFPDHHQYTRKDMDLLVQRFGSMQGKLKYIITTEKDAVRLKTNPYFPHELKPYIFYLPVRVEFVDRSSQTSQSDFDKTLLRLLDNCDTMIR